MFGTTVNPVECGRVPGGSSGGAATAVAAGLTAFEIGTDIGGSIRFPSSFCGVFGHKPSWGVVPSTGYIDHEAGGTTEADVNVLGPHRAVGEDLELLLELILRKEAAGGVPRSATGERQVLKVAAWLDDRLLPGRPERCSRDGGGGGQARSGRGQRRSASPAESGSESRLGIGAGW